MGLNQRFSGRRFRRCFKLIWNGGLCSLRGVDSGAHWPIKARSGWERRHHFSLKFSRALDSSSSSSFKNPRTSSVLQWLPRDEREKRSQPPQRRVLLLRSSNDQSPVGIFPFWSEIFISLKADFWLSLDESRMINHDLVILGSLIPWISLDFLTGNIRTEGSLLQASRRSYPLGGSHPVEWQDAKLSFEV